MLYFLFNKISNNVIERGLLLRLIFLAQCRRNTSDRYIARFAPHIQCHIGQLFAIKYIGYRSEIDIVSNATSLRVYRPMFITVDHADSAKYSDSISLRDVCDWTGLSDDEFSWQI